MSTTKVNQSFEPYKIAEEPNFLSKISKTTTLQQIQNLTQVLLKRSNNAQKIKFSAKNFFSKCEQIYSFCGSVYIY